jgi:hypothetical protein
MRFTEPVDWVNKPFEGYIVNAKFSDENAQTIEDLIKEIGENFRDSVLCMPKRSLHITLLDWVAPLVDYSGENKSELFAKIRAEYDGAMESILSSLKPFEVRFNEIHVSPNTIFITGQDDGQFQAIRDQFLDKVQLIPHTKLPPKIIHSSLVRFTEKIDLDQVENYVKSMSINFKQTITEFRLIRTKREPMLEFDILKRYKLLK